jgi:homoserine O-succinyltransferase
VARILRYARNNIPATLGIGWGAQMLASFIGAGSRLLGQKQFGVYEARNLDEVHRITSAMDDVFCCPVSRRSAVDDDALEREQKQGAIELLARSDQAGYLMAESSDHRFLMHFGHPEYEVADMVREYRHANGENGGGGSVPENFDETKTVNCWRGHCTALFTGWIRYIHETRTF